MLLQAIQELLKRGMNVPLGNPLDPSMGQVPGMPSNATPSFIPGPDEVKNARPDMRPEPTMVENVPTDAPSPSVPMPSAEVPPTKKRGGILGALESVFMPDPGSRWAAALRGGLFDAKANQALYRETERERGTKAAMDQVSYQMAQAKLKNLLTKGEYQIAGNNIVHFPPNGGEPKIITPPSTPGEKERLIDAWRKEADPQVKEMIERMIMGANDPDVIREKGATAASTAEARAAANARHRAPSSTVVIDIPSGWTVVK